MGRLSKEKYKHRQYLLALSSLNFSCEQEFHFCGEMVKVPFTRAHINYNSKEKKKKH